MYLTQDPEAHPVQHMALIDAYIVMRYKHAHSDKANQPQNRALQMKWRGRRSSSNIEDRRGISFSTGAGGAGLIRLLPILLRFLGFKGTALVVLGFVGYTLFTGGDLASLLGSSATPKQTQQPIKQSTEEKQLVQFVSVVLADTETTWHQLFKQVGKEYKEPKLVLFRSAVKSACGFGKSAMGPFYCPADQKVYIDLSFYHDLKTRHKAPGDFAQAYVIAHEVGHHVQTLLGISAKVSKAKQGVSRTAANKLSVKQELQADCLAGVWAHHAKHSRQLLETGDIEEGLTAASAIGDDRLQKQGQGYVVPESFTHGSSEQRVKWFKQGINTGKVSACNTFKANT